MLSSLLLSLLYLRSAWAAPTETPVLSIPVRDIIARDLSAHEAHPNFKLYTRWLESPQGSYIKRDPGAAFTKHPNLASIDCHAEHDDCLLTSRVKFADITKDKRELDELIGNLEAQIQTSDDEDPAAVLTKTLNKRASAGDYIITTHYKTYHDLGEDEQVAGYQHYLTWDLKCEEVQFTSSGFQLTSKTVFEPSKSGITTNLYATLVGDQDPASTHGVEIIITFACGLFNGKCCLQSYHSYNYYGGHPTDIPKSEPLECVSAKSASKHNCDSYTGGWCGVHIRQYQKNEGEGLNTENYRFDVSLYDADQALVGEYELISIPSGETHQFGSPLPMTFGVTAPEVDGDAVYMSYNGENWGSNDQEHSCDFGKYDSGHRDGDCGFTC